MIPFFSRVFDLMAGCHVPSVYHTIGTVGTGSAKKKKVSTVNDLLNCVVNRK